ncbi:MAG: hypothetical protein V4482_00780 [Pseudomonadota bacterium]
MLKKVLLLGVATFISAQSSMIMAAAAPAPTAGDIQNEFATLSARFEAYVDSNALDTQAKDRTLFCAQRDLDAERIKVAGFSTASTTISGLEADVLKAKDELDNAVSALTVKEGERDDALNAAKALKSQLIDEKKTVNDLQADNTAKDLTISGFRKDILTLDSQVSNYVARLTAQVPDYDALKALNDAATTDLATTAGELTALKDELVLKTNTVDDLTTRLTVATSTSSANESTLNSKVAELKTANEKLVETISGCMQSLDDASSDFQTKLSEARSECETLQEELEETKNTLDKTKTNYERLLNEKHLTISALYPNQEASGELVYLPSHVQKLKAELRKIIMDSGIESLNEDISIHDMVSRVSEELRRVSDELNEKSSASALERGEQQWYGQVDIPTGQVDNASK